MNLPPAYLLWAPYGPTDWQCVADENTAYTLAERLTSEGTEVVALIGEHTADELLTALRKERAVHVARLAAQVADATRYPCCRHCACPADAEGHPVRCVQCQTRKPSLDQAVAEEMNAA